MGKFSGSLNFWVTLLGLLLLWRTTSYAYVPHAIPQTNGKIWPRPQFVNASRKVLQITSKFKWKLDSNLLDKTSNGKGRFFGKIKFPILKYNSVGVLKMFQFQFFSKFTEKPLMFVDFFSFSGSKNSWLTKFASLHHRFHVTVVSHFFYHYLSLLHNS